MTVLEPEPPWAELARQRRRRSDESGGGGREALTSPMQGTVLAVHVAEGDEVSAGQLICIVEAMKMENEVHAHRAGHRASAVRRRRRARDDGPGHLRRRGVSAD